MNDQFDELTKATAQSVTRRGALKKFGVGLASIVLVSLGLANKAEAGCKHSYGYCRSKCKKLYPNNSQDFDVCMNFCLDPGGCVG